MPEHVVTRINGRWRIEFERGRGWHVYNPYPWVFGWKRTGMFSSPAEAYRYIDGYLNPYEAA